MRLLVTRALDEALRTRGRLEALGHQVVTSPLLIVEATQAPWPAQKPDAVIATSARAFVGLKSGHDWAALPLHVVGARTEAAARAAGFVDVVTVAPHGAALVDRLARLAPSHLVYLAGEDRKPTIEATLRDAARHRLDVVVTYRAKAAESLTSEAVMALRRGEIDAMLHYSHRSAALFVEHAARAALPITGITHLCLSQDVAEPLRTIGCGALRIAAAPDQKAMIALLTNGL